MYRIKNWDGICQRLGSSGQKSFRKGPVWVCCFFILSFQSSLAWETHQKISSLNLVWEPRVSWAELCSLSGKGALVLSWRLPDLPPTLPGLCSPNADLERPFIMLSCIPWSPQRWLWVLNIYTLTTTVPLHSTVGVTRFCWNLFHVYLRQAVPSPVCQCCLVAFRSIWYIYTTTNRNHFCSLVGGCSS